MTHLYTRGCEYALRALRVLVNEPDRLVTVAELCEKADIPEPFTRKMVQQLVRAGVITSRRGPGGGFCFDRNPKQITLMEVVTAIEDGPRTDQCVLGNKECDDSNPCPLHFSWSPIKTAANRMLQTRTIADLGRTPKPRLGRSGKAKKKRARKSRA